MQKSGFPKMRGVFAYRVTFLVVKTSLVQKCDAYMCSIHRFLCCLTVSTWINDKNASLHHLWLCWRYTWCLSWSQASLLAAKEDRSIEASYYCNIMECDIITTLNSGWSVAQSFSKTHLAVGIIVVKLPSLLLQRLSGSNVYGNITSLLAITLLSAISYNGLHT